MSDTERDSPAKGEITEVSDSREMSSASEKGPLANRAEMPFLDHLEELRWRLLKVLLAVLVGAVICFVFSERVLHVLTLPYNDAVTSQLNGRDSGSVEAIQQLLQQWADEIGGEGGEDAAIRAAASPVPEGRQLQALGPMTYFFLKLQVAFLGGIAISLPAIFFQIWQFVAPGLLARERGLFLPVVGLSVICFVVGGLIAYSIVLPLGLRFFLGLEPPDMTSQWAADQYMSFVMRLLLGFGLVFEMPVITLLLSRLGLVTPELMRRVRRYALVAIFLLAAIFTPPDPISQLLMAIPLIALYEISIVVCRISRRKSNEDSGGGENSRREGAGEGPGKGPGEEELA